MNGHVFQCFEERRDPVQFTKTMEALNNYAKRKLKTTDLGSLFLSPVTQPTIELPADVGANPTDVELLIQREEVKQYVSRTKDLKGHLAALHSVTWGQCSEALKAKLKSLTGFKEKFEGHDCVWLFGKISSVMQKFEETRHAYTSMVVVMNNLSSCRQGPEQIVSDYIDRIRTIAETIKHHGGSIGDFFLSGTPAPDDDGTDAAATARATETRRKASREAYLATLCIQNADRGRFGTLIAHLANQFLLGRNEYPCDLTEAQGLLHNYQTPANAVRCVPANISTTRPPAVSAPLLPRLKGPPTPSSLEPAGAPTTTSGVINANSSAIMPRIAPAALVHHHRPPTVLPFYNTLSSWLNMTMLSIPTGFYSTPKAPFPCLTTRTCSPTFATVAALYAL